MVMQGELQFPKDSWRLTLPRKFDKVAQKEFEARIQQILSGGYIRLSLDLSLVAFVSNSGLGQIAMTCLDLKSKGIQVTVVGISQKVQGLLDRHGLSDLLAAAKL
jgi:anti-anti-sigma factor